MRFEPVGVRFITLVLVTLVSIVATESVAQQRNATIEIFVMRGPYAFGNLVIVPQSTSISPQWRPHVGGGVLLPFARNWAALIDLTTSVVDLNWKWDGDNIGAGPDDNFTQVRRFSLAPTLIRLWRWESFSIYVGGGLAVEHDREKNRFRRIVARSNTRPVLAEEFTEARYQHTGVAPGFRGGLMVSLSPRFVARVGYGYFRRYDDLGGSQAIETGIGYRF